MSLKDNMKTSKLNSCIRRINSLNGAIYSLNSKIESLTQQLESTKKDAERYRFLRARKLDWDEIMIFPYIHASENNDKSWLLIGDEADNVIDAAIKESK